MRALNAQQAANCEKAVSPRCRCRCGGVAHGAARIVEAERELFEQLPVDDPHWIPEHRQMRLPKAWLPQPTTAGVPVAVTGEGVASTTTASSGATVTWTP